MGACQFALSARQYLGLLEFSRRHHGSAVCGVCIVKCSLGGLCTLAFMHVWSYIAMRPANEFGYRKDIIMAFQSPVGYSIDTFSICFTLYKCNSHKSWLLVVPFQLNSMTHAYTL